MRCNSPAAGRHPRPRAYSRAFRSAPCMIRRVLVLGAAGGVGAGAFVREPSRPCRRADEDHERGRLIPCAYVAVMRLSLHENITCGVRRLDEVMRLSHGLHHRRGVPRGGCPARSPLGAAREGRDTGFFPGLRSSSTALQRSPRTECRISRRVRRRGGASAYADVPKRHTRDQGQRPCALALDTGRTFENMWIYSQQAKLPGIQSTRDEGLGHSGLLALPVAASHPAFDVRRRGAAPCGR